MIVTLTKDWLERSNSMESLRSALKEGYKHAMDSAKQSKDTRLQVGSSVGILKYDYKAKKEYYHHLYSDYNRLPKNCKSETLVQENGTSVPYLLHSEVATLLNARFPIEDCLKIMVVTHCPCIKCASLILEKGIDVLFFKGTHDNHEGITFLEENLGENILLLDYSNIVSDIHT